MKYRIYIDEVGNPDLESSENPNHRFLSLTGVIMELGYVQAVVFPQLEALKAKYFHSHPSRNEILQENGFLEKGLPPFGKAISQVLQGKYYQRGGRVFGKKFL